VVTIGAQSNFSIRSVPLEFVRTTELGRKSETLVSVCRTKHFDLGGIKNGRMKIESSSSENARLISQRM
jgi:hypothetical protein